MTIRITKQWNGYSPDAIVTLSGAEETRLVNLGFATFDLDGDNDGERGLVEFRKNITGRSVFQTAQIADAVVHAVGDSRMAQHFNAIQNGPIRYNTGPLHWARGCGNTNFTFGAAQCFGVAGKRTDQYADQVALSISKSPSAVLIFGIMNDVGQLDTFYGGDVALCATTAVNNLLGYAKQYIAIGCRPVLMTDYPSTAATPAQRKAVLLANSLLRNGCKNNQLISLADTNKHIIDFANTTYTTLSAMLQGDGIHLSPRAAYYIGRYELAPILENHLPKIGFGICTSAAEIRANDPKSWSVNPLWINRNTGSYGAGVTTYANGDGTTAAGATLSATSGVPAGCDVSVSGTGTINFTLPAGKYGYKPTMVCSWTGAGVESRFRFDTLEFASVTPGDKFIIEGKISVTNPVGLAGVKAYMDYNNGASSQVVDLQIWAGNIAGPDESFTYYFTTEDLTIPSGTPVWFIANIRAVSSGTGSATIVVESCRTRQVN